MAREDGITSAAYAVGRDLESTTNSTLLSSVDPQVVQALAQFLTTPDAYDEFVYSGDEPSPMGDGTATHRLYLKNGNGAWIALRLRNDRRLQKFQVLGCYTPPNPPADSNR